jgi:hypothetical protein
VPNRRIQQSRAWEPPYGRLLGGTIIAHLSRCAHAAHRPPLGRQTSASPAATVHCMLSQRAQGTPAGRGLEWPSDLKRLTQPVCTHADI